MKRIQRVEQLLLQWTTECFDTESMHPHRPQGCTAELIGESLGIDRSNASRDLNSLVAEQKVIKIGGKPVLFLSYEGLKQKFGHKLARKHLYDSWSDFYDGVSEGNGEQPDVYDAPRYVHAASAFDSLQGKSRSLKKPIELAKAAILYPPNGLHTLLVGPTGVGKTLFADSMYQFAVETGQLPPNAPFISFNCADYSNNPQLLLAQLFGVEKGAYTGAERDRVGMVEKANGGILFLDEVHRLPPEGQEMLFQLLDKGIFRRLGETDSQRTATIRLIAATTENPKSSLLMTFVRRLPMLIPIPSIAERTLQERFCLIEYFFSEESARVQRPFRIAPEVLKALLLFDCPANVGQLKSEIQLLSARAFLSQIHDTHTNRLKVTLDHASDHVRQGLMRIPERRKELDQVLENLSTGLDLNREETEAARTEDQSLYEILEQQAQELRKRGLSEEEITNVLSVDIDVYFRKFLQRVSDQFESRRQDIIRIVGEQFLDTIEEMFDFASRYLQRVFPSQTVFGCALHMHAAVDRIRAGTAIPNPGLAAIQRQASLEYETAQEMASMFAQRTNVTLPENEIGFLATILLSVLNTTPSPKVGILVIAHGSSTASSMLEVAHQLLGTAHGRALDMPLDTDPDLVLEQAVSTAGELDEGKGILLLVDMGSLVSFGQLIQERTGIQVRTIPNVTTLVVMEAVRKAALSSSTLEMVYESVLKGSAFTQSRRPYPPVRTGVLPVVCVTGQGSAIQLKSILEERLQLPDDYELNIVPVSISSFEETPECLEKLLGGVKPLAIAGTLNPHMEGIPFVSAQEILSGEGIHRIAHLIQASLVPVHRSEESNSVWDSLSGTLRNSVKRVNPYYAVPAIIKAFDRLEEKLDIRVDTDIRIGLTMHLVLAMEKRLVTGSWPTEAAGENASACFSGECGVVADIFNAVMADFGLAIPESESSHILRLLGGVRVGS
ncbi:sigma-54-dependent transcriptional regulator [Effusibacillus consociatus]|uniref:Sigma-54-dependent transcriptional regulator n=1 Tax=Effusibacillus consociatus TaxID=1117041 RepID=A0ABV9Q352_9BACL